MRKPWTPLFALYLLAGIFFAACGPTQPRPLLPNLPTAVQPDPNQIRVGQDGTWAISFAHEFAADFWSAGPHQYTLISDCPIVIGGGETITRQAFVASEDVPLYDGPIYLRLAGLSVGVIDPIIEPIQTIHPRQATIAVVTFPQLPESALEAIAQECSVTFVWDDESNVQPLEPQQPFEP